MATESNSKFHQSAIPGNSDPHDPAKMMLCASKFEGRLCTKGRDVEGTLKGSDVPISVGTDLKGSITTPHPKQQTTRDVATVKQEPSAISKTSPNVPPSESFENMNISSALQEHYINDDLLDLNEVTSTYEDEVPLVVPGWRGKKSSFEAGSASDQRRGGCFSGDESTPGDRGYGEGGHRSVTYNRSGHGGRFEVDNRTSAYYMPAAISRSTNSSEGYPTSLPSTRNNVIRGSGSSFAEERTVPCLDFRIIEVRRESPVFEDDSPTAPSQIDATHKSPSRSNHEDRNSSFLVAPMAIPRSTNSSGTSPITIHGLPVESTMNDLAMRDDDSGYGSLQGTRRHDSLECTFSVVVNERKGTPVFEGSSQTAEFESVGSDLSNCEFTHRRASVEAGPGIGWVVI